MISYIRGQLTEILEDAVVVEAAGIGYRIGVPVSVLDELPGTGGEVKIYTYFQVREDAMNLYGFLNRGDLRMFEQLIAVNGIGPKGALAVLSVMRPDDLRLAIVSADAKAIAKAPGVGIKTAQRVILDLKDKIQTEELLGAMSAPAAAIAEKTQSTGLHGSSGEALEALVALGYSNMEAARAVRQVQGSDEMTAEEVLKASLKYLVF